MEKRLLARSSLPSIFYGLSPHPLEEVGKVAGHCKPEVHDFRYI
jgi:hypothetical protein